MQAKLPDLNAAIVRHRTGALVAIPQGNYNLAATELSAINALLPEEYKVKIDSKIYFEKIRGQDVMECNSCKEENEYRIMKFYNKSLVSGLQLLYGVEKIEFWKCLKCDMENPKEGSKRIIKKYENPFYTSYMPKPPKRDSFGNNMAFTLKFEEWFDIALSELENKIGIYRTDYAAQESDGSVSIPDEEI